MKDLSHISRVLLFKLSNFKHLKLKWTIIQPLSKQITNRAMIAGRVYDIDYSNSVLEYFIHNFKWTNDKQSLHKI